MRSSFSDTGIVIRSVDSGEADKFISIITENHGLQDFLARGARRLASKKAPHLDLFNLIKFQSGRGEHPRFLDQVESIEYFPKIKKDFSKIGLCLTIIEILINTLPIEVEDREIFLSLKSFLEAVEKSDSQKETNRLGRKFGLFLLRHLGYPPPKLSASAKLTNYFESIMSKKLIGPLIK
ncbi:MAG TPA: DNA repair protein RecO [Spirochaetia bacterium]|nr:DNA repair protein RecO [Spirochaetia bacterium]